MVSGCVITMGTLVRDHTVRFMPMGKMEGSKFSDLIIDNYNAQEITCVQQNGDGSFEFTFSSEGRRDKFPGRS